jgi:hypothetical protein
VHNGAPVTALKEPPNAVATTHGSAIDRDEVVRSLQGAAGVVPKMGRGEFFASYRNRFRIDNP